MSWFKKKVPPCEIELDAGLMWENERARKLKKDRHNRQLAEAMTASYIARIDLQQTLAVQRYQAEAQRVIDKFEMEEKINKDMQRIEREVHAEVEAKKVRARARKYWGC